MNAREEIRIGPEHVKSGTKKWTAKLLRNMPGYTFPGEWISLWYEPWVNIFVQRGEDDEEEGDEDGDDEGDYDYDDDDEDETDTDSDYSHKSWSIYDLDTNTKPMTPDGASFKDWVDNPRPTLLQGGEKELYEKYETWENIIPKKFKPRYEGDSRVQMMASKFVKVRHMCSDEQFIRFQKGYWRIIVYLNLRLAINRSLARLDVIYDELQPMVGVLEARGQDEMAGTVWSKEDRLEDVKNNARAIIRRETAVTEEER